MLLNIHKNIKEKLNYFHTSQKIPNILFHGQSGTGKYTIVNEFVQKIYNHNSDKIKNHVMIVNCSYGKGIKFIREELKFFAKTHINSCGGNYFKTIVLLNADKLTMDAQSALRRCIELFSHNTRFFIVAENKDNLMRPILSRFCEIYVPNPIINNKPVNLYKYQINQTYKLEKWETKRITQLKKELNTEIQTIQDLIKISNKLYNKGYSAYDIFKILEEPSFLEIGELKKYELLMCFHRIKKEFRNEKLLILFVLNFIFISSNVDLENISFM